MKKTVVLAGIAGLALVQFASATIIIGTGIGNGDVQNNGTLTGLRADGTTPITPVTNAAGRQFLGNSEINATFSMNQWSGKRLSYPGSNNAWGLDAANGAFGSPNIYFFINSGSFQLTHDTVAVSASAGDTVTVSFDLFANGGPASADGKITMGGVDYTWTASSSAGSVLNFSTGPMTLTAAASDAVLAIDLSTVTSGNQALLDNVQVEVIPEPATIGMVAVFGGALLFIRRRFKI